MTPIFSTLFSPTLWLSLVVVMAIIPLVGWVCRQCGLLDHPGGRKQHAEPVPLSGGPSVYISVMATIISLMPSVLESGFFWSLSGLFVVGLADDRFDISPKLRLGIQTLLVGWALYHDQVWISHIGNIGSLSLDLGWFGLPLTIVGVLGIMNAINMLDGVDGLASGVLLITLAAIGVVGVQGELGATAEMASLLFGAVLGFWVYNYRFPWRKRAKLFMGDSGTMLLGFAVPYLAIQLAGTKETQGILPSYLILWLFALPIWDICSVVYSRRKRGVSPVIAGRDHIHHILMGLGLNVRRTVHLIYLLTLLGIAFGLALAFVGASLVESTVMFIAATVLYVACMNRFYREVSARTSADVSVIRFKQSGT